MIESRIVDSIRSESVCADIQHLLSQPDARMRTQRCGGEVTSFNVSGTDGNYTFLAIQSYGGLHERAVEDCQLASRNCPRHGSDYPCTCAMGNLYRFVEPVVLLLLKKKGRAYGYDLSGDLQDYALTDADIERGALYRTLRQLETNGNVKSEWDVESAGPARRVYRLTARGEKHLQEWAAVLDHVSKAMARFVKETRALGSGKRAAAK